MKLPAWLVDFWRGVDLVEMAPVEHDHWIGRGRIVPVGYRPFHPYKLYFYVRLPSWRYQRCLWNDRFEWHRLVVWRVRYVDGARHLEDARCGWHADYLPEW